MIRDEVWYWEKLKHLNENSRIYQKKCSRGLVVCPDDHSPRFTFPLFRISLSDRSLFSVWCFFVLCYLQCSVYVFNTTINPLRPMSLYVSDQSPRADLQSELQSTSAWPIFTGLVIMWWEGPIWAQCLVHTGPDADFVIFVLFVMFHVHWAVLFLPEVDSVDWPHYM